MRPATPAGSSSSSSDEWAQASRAGADRDTTFFGTRFIASASGAERRENTSHARRPSVEDRAEREEILPGPQREPSRRPAGLPIFTTP